MLEARPVAMGLTQPTFAAGIPGDPTRILVLEKAGRVALVQGGTVSTYLDLSSQVITNGEGGLLGLAFHPQFAQNGRFFVFFNSAPRGEAILGEYRRTSDTAADPQRVATVLTAPTSGWNHNGGMLAFGKDGYLYAAVGDTHAYNDAMVSSPARDLGSRLGKILRIDVDAAGGPAAPPGNMTGAGVDPFVWDFGLRNPWRFSVDRKTGDLYIADVGEHTWEEINVEPAGTGQRDYGWDVMEGPVCYRAGCMMAGLLPALPLPNAEWILIGGYVYRGAAIPCLRGRYVYGGFLGDVGSFRWDGARITAEQRLTTDLRPNGNPAWQISSFGEDGAGELLVVDYSGALYRIHPQ